METSCTVQHLQHQAYSIVAIKHLPFACYFTGSLHSHLYSHTHLGCVTSSLHLFLANQKSWQLWKTSNTSKVSHLSHAVSCFSSFFFFTTSYTIKLLRNSLSIRLFHLASFTEHMLQYAGLTVLPLCLKCSSITFAKRLSTLFLLYFYQSYDLFCLHFFLITFLLSL